MPFVIAAATTLLLLGYLAVVVRRRQDVSAASIAVSVAAYAVVALASFLAVRSFAGAIDEMARTDGGISVVVHGMWQATRLPLAAAWAAAIVTAIALVLAAIRADARPPHSSAWLWMAGAALLSGSAAVLLFRGAMMFVIDVIRPGSPRPLGAVTIPDAVAARLLDASAGSALCFLVAVTLAVTAARMGGRSESSPRLAVMVLVIALGLSAALVTVLDAHASRYRNFSLHGPVATQATVR